MSIAARLGQHRTVYYGWFIVFAALIAQMAAASIQNHSSTVFLKPMTEDLGWSRGDFTWGQTLGTLVMSGGGFFVGSLIDARGPRRFMLIGACIAGVAVMLMSQVQELWQYIALRGVGVTFGSIMMGNMVVNVTVSKWFVRNRAWAVATATTGLSISGVITPQVCAPLIEAYGWRTSWVVLGVAVLVLVLPAAMIMRRRPEDYGLLPDGDEPLGTPEEEAARPKPRSRYSAATEVQWTRAEAVHTRAFWLLVLSFALASFGQAAVMLHLVSYLTDNGYSASAAARHFSVALFSALCSRALWGTLMQRFAPRYCSAAGFAMSAAATMGIVLSLSAGNDALLYLSLITWGVGFGGSAPLHEMIWATYFGRNHIGRVRSIALPLTAIASAIGPQFAARIFDATGSYSTAFTIQSATWLLAILCVIQARPPQKPKLEDVDAPPEALAGVPAGR